MSKLFSQPMRHLKARVLLVFALASLVLQLAHAQSQPWPTRQFQVVEMTQDEIQNDTDGVINNVIGAFSDDVAGDPARAEQRAEIERYLVKVADQLEAWGFPPPALSRVVELENGEMAYRVYSITSIGTSRYIPSNGGSLRLYLADINLSQNLDFQDYATIAHELFHAVQYNTRFFSVEPGRVGDWITEGQAEAVGEDLAWKYAPDDASRNAMDWGRRDYAQPLTIARRDPGGTGEAYDTASFWRYLAERDYLSLTSGPTDRPGIAAPAGNVHYSYLASLLSNPPQPRDCLTNDDRCPLEIQWLNAGLLGYDNFQQPLRNIFAEFVVTVAAYGDPGGRAQAENDASPLGADSWRSGVLGDCVKEIVDGPILEYGKTLRFHGVSARCVVIPDFFNGETEVFVQVRARSSELQDQILFGLAGDPTSATPVLTESDRSRGAKSAVWPVSLKPGRDNVLVFANAALDAPKTKDQDMEITILLEYASMGRSLNNAADASTANPATLATAIDAPLEFELTKYQATLLREKHKKSGETFIGIGHAAGVGQPCLLQLSGESDRRPGAQYRDRLILKMRTSGPITAGKSYPIESSENIRGLADLSTDVAFASAMMPEANGEQYAFDIENGTLKFDSVAGNFLVGQLMGDGVYKEYSQQTLKYEVRKVQRIVAKFAIRVKALLGQHRDKPYACLASAEGG